MRIPTDKKSSENIWKQSSGGKKTPVIDSIFYYQRARAEERREKERRGKKTLDAFTEGNDARCRGMKIQKKKRNERNGGVRF